MPAKADTLRKLTRYSCSGCGAKELYLYCWKGCRNIQNMKPFYIETKEVYEEVDTLRETIYEQEVRIRELESELTVTQNQKHQSLEFLLKETQKLPELLPLTKEQKERRTYPSHLPEWRVVAMKMIRDCFDSDGDGKLNRAELDALKNHLGQSNKNSRSIREDIDGTLGKAVEVDVDGLLAVYERRGNTQLLHDLRSLNIHFGSLCMKPRIICGMNNVVTEQDLPLQCLLTFRNRACNRLREGYAEVKAEVEKKNVEVGALRSEQTKLTSELQIFRGNGIDVWLTLQLHCQIGLTCFRILPTMLAGDLGKAKTELVAAKRAVVDLRALVEDQVSEREKWQRYCWELEERVHDAVHSSQEKEVSCHHIHILDDLVLTPVYQRDLWKTRDAKKEETRKNMRLYIESQRGKKHFLTPAQTAVRCETQMQVMGPEGVSDGDSLTSSDID
ncbi:TPA: LOW QUALITY PROTEIN: hypothetical protein N0F65_009378 [Lagenidium giganteum]|uniref:EF-hand domain-containing protein n=1 Tax=Lagenidium giganteum TaxID=4803 RepID=A0AAV2Z9D0_9STRA|nr:TPA: LOW QUALITY PROTEIN: hypothetical protein N0F65_009378 [Lagenidium giganteum]